MSTINLFPGKNQSKNEPATFRCDICLVAFRASNERNLHILNHFKKSDCSVCQQSLILIGNIWYGAHEHPIHDERIKPDTIKSEFNANDTDEYIIEPIILPDFIEIKPDDATNSKNDPPFHEPSQPVRIDVESYFDPIFNEINHVTNNENLVEVNNPEASEHDSNQIELAVAETNDSNIDADQFEDGSPNDDSAESGDEVAARNKNPEIANDSKSHFKSKNASGTCTICNKKFTCRTGLKYHMNVHLNIKFTCDICGKSWADKRRLTTHMRTHIHTELHINDYIGTESNKKARLTKEQLKDLVCPICDQKFTARKALRDHVHGHDESRHLCKICGKTFRDVNNYKRHRITVHKNMASDDNDDGLQFNIRDYGDDGSKEGAPSAVDWVCEYCNCDFEFELRLAKHIIREHSENKPEHLCNICDGKFSKPSALLSHMRAHPESTQHKCTFDGCEQGFAFKSSLGVHLNKHNRISGRIERKTQDKLTELIKQHADMEMMRDDKTSNQDKMLTCSSCDKTFSARSNLMSHIQLVHMNNEWLKCTVAGCTKIFKSISGITHHMQNSHPDALRKCEICQKSFYSDEKLAEHRKKHDKSKQAVFDCNICGRQFAEKFRLRSHLTQHEKDATCNICNEKFSSVRMMMAHRERHGKKQIITCRYKDCNQTFECRREFRQHSKQHTYAKRKRFICSYCGKAVASMAYLRGHINTHTGETPFKCSYCGKAFSKDGSLRRHILIHTGEKPYSCDQPGCSQAYRDSIDLKRHKFSAHNIYFKKHICTICSKVFPERKLLTKHTNSVHGKIDIQPTS